MKYCLTYLNLKNKEVPKKLSELKVAFDPLDKSLPQFLEKYSDKTIILVTNDIDPKNIRLLKALPTNYKICFDWNNDADDFIKQLQESRIPFFFTNLVTNWDTFHGLLSYNPTDIYISGDLGFQLDKVARAAHSCKVAVRAFPNICQAEFINRKESLYTFFVRPEDIHTYERYIDVMEFWCRPLA